MLDFTKNDKGLAGVYEDDYQKKLKNLNPDAFIDNGEDAPIKKEVESIFLGVMNSLNRLSHVHYAPKKLTDKTDIRT